VTRLVGAHRDHLHQRVQCLRDLGQRHPADRGHHPAGKYDIGIAVGLESTRAAPSHDDPAKLALPQWYANNGQFVTTKFLR
jgi:hypothetical protein